MVQVMAWRKKDEGAQPAGEIQIYGTDRGVLVEGSPTEVAELIDQLMATTKEAGGHARHMVVDGVQIAANVVAYRQTYREYFEFSQRALMLLRERGAIPTADGFFRSFVRKGAHFAGNLDWKPVNLGPEQALGLQAMAGQMALRAAVKEITVAIERVEGKVDKIADLAKAERLGACVADRSTLLPMVERVRSTGHLSNTDWAIVASLGPWIARDIGSLRAYILVQLSKVGESPLVRSRASDAEDLTDQLIKESAALLVVAEENYALWQELHIAHAASHEPTALANVTNDVRRQLNELTKADQLLVDKLREVIHQLTAPTGFEGFAPLQKRKLTEHAEEFAALRTWFGDQRHLDFDADELPELPGFGETLAKVGQAISSTSRSMTKSIGDVAQHLRRAGELSSGEAVADA
jgi:hypothetical protein